MNLHAPQSVEAATELREIAAVPLQIVSPRESVPIVSVVQDTLVGANRFTRPNVLFTRKETFNLLIHAKRWEGNLPPPVVTEPQPLWSGQQILSALLPPVSLDMPNNSYSDEDKKNPASQNMVKIQNGHILQGILDKSVFSKQLLHIIYNDYGHEITVDFLDSLQALIATFLMNSGFSVGISDLVADDATNSEINLALKKFTKAVEDQILQLHTGLFENTSGRSNQEEFESKAMSTLNKALGEAGKIGLRSLADTNRMTNMIKAGSKGTDLNVSQMVALLGQTAIEGKRVPNGFQQRTLPHFKRFDDSAQARGFIASSYIKGLQPDEFFFHAMSGREGLIDTAVKTADTGYMQRQIRVALEDLITQHDGSVRDTNGNLLQLAYGEDGINATKLESQTLPLASLSDADIREQFAAEGVAAEAAEAYIKAVIEDRRILVEKVFLRKPQKNVRYPVHLERTIKSLKAQFGLTAAGTVTATEALAAHAIILNRTHANNKLWGALVRFHLSPLRLKAFGYTKVALDMLVEQIVLKHWKSWVEPGQPVGVIAAQSIGEPATQMTLNSVDWDTEIIISKDGQIVTPKIGEFIDTYIKNSDPTKIQYLPNDQLYIPLDDGHRWEAISCDENGEMVWTRLEAVTKHPVINEDGTDTILEVTTESGRIVKATKGKSFLTLRNSKIVDINGSELKIGDILPISNTMAMDDKRIINTWNLKNVLPPSEWLYGEEVQKAFAAMKAADVSGVRHWFSNANGKQFTVPYNRSDSFRNAFEHGHNTGTILPGFVYPKSTRSCTSQIPSELVLNREFGFFIGAYISEGSSSTTQIQITNNDDTFLEPIRTLLDSWSVGHHTVTSEKTIVNTGICGTTTSLIIHSTLLTTILRSTFGRISHEKTIPNWVLQAPDSFILGLIDGYFSGDGTVSKAGTIQCSSASADLMTRMSLLLSRYGIFTKFSLFMPKKGRFQTVRRQYSLYIAQKYARVFAKQIQLRLVAKQERLNAILTKEHTVCKYKEFNDVVMDRVKTIREVSPKGGRVYDVTVERTRNFTTINQLCVKDTFHLAGVASKSNMTRGVPRLKELLKATRNPKAIELTIPLRRDLSTKKEEARRVAQELEFTLLSDIVTVARIYFDPSDSATLIAADVDWLAYMVGYEEATQTAAPIAQTDPLTGEGEGEAAAARPSRSPWVLRAELDREKMFTKNITMDDIALILRTKFSDSITTLYTDYNSSQLVFRIRVESNAASAGPSPIDELATLKTLQNKILSGTAVRGIPGLRTVNYQKVADTVELKDGKYVPLEEYVLISDGSNFLDVLTHPDVDASRVISSNVHDMFENLGIEATRATFYKEITTLFAESGSSVNYRHVCVLLDKICCKGRTMSIDRYGINKNDIGPLAKMSFEQTEDIALRAAIFGERDPVLGISAKVMLGAPIKAGTSFSEILFDEIDAIHLSESTPEQRTPVISGPQQFTGEELRDGLYDTEVEGDCSAANLRIPVSLPAANTLETVEEMEDVDIAVYE